MATAYIGLSETSADVWEWDDGSSLDFTAWGEGEPNQPYELCAAIYLSGGVYGVADVDCALPHAFICQMPREGKMLSTTGI